PLRPSSSLFPCSPHHRALRSFPTRRSSDLPYSQELISTDAIEVDHIFPLSAAWDHGAYQWDDATRQQFANDPLNLVATSRELNQSKSDSLPEEWLPPHPDRKSTRLNSSHVSISYAVFCLK